MSILGGPAASIPAPSQPPISDRQRGLRKALDFLHSHPHEAFSVTDLCSAIETSERVLQYAFREHFDVTPRAYLKAARLIAVRRQLRQSDPRKGTITNLANDWDFCIWASSPPTTAATSASFRQRPYATVGADDFEDPSRPRVCDNRPESYETWPIEDHGHQALPDPVVFARHPLPSNSAAFTNPNSCVDAVGNKSGTLSRKPPPSHRASRSAPVHPSPATPASRRVPGAAGQDRGAHPGSGPLSIG